MVNRPGVFSHPCFYLSTESMIMLLIRVYNSFSLLTSLIHQTNPMYHGLLNKTLSFQLWTVQFNCYEGYSLLPVTTQVVFKSESFVISTQHTRMQVVFLITSHMRLTVFSVENSPAIQLTKRRKKSAFDNTGIICVRRRILLMLS